MANQEQLAILMQGVEVWNKWREKNPDVPIDLIKADLDGADLRTANLRGADLDDASFKGADLRRTDFTAAFLHGADLTRVILDDTNFSYARLTEVNFGSPLVRSINFSRAHIGRTVFGDIFLSRFMGLETVVHEAPSMISTGTLALSQGSIPAGFLRGCGLSDWEIEEMRLYNPALSNEEISDIQYKIYDMRATQALQISPLFISYSHADSTFVDKLESHLNQKRIRFWRDIHELKAGRIEKQIDKALSQNPTVLLILSSSSLKSDWVEHEVRAARGLEKELERDVLCPVALDESWKSSRWSARVMEQIMEYNILDFSEWKDDSKFDSMFRRLIDGLELFYKG